jgi:hypothetical protein
MPKPNFRSIRKAAVIKDADGKQLAVGGYRADQKRDNTQKYSYSGSKKLPQAVDLRPYLTPIENQGDSNSCTANATAGAHEYLLKRLKGQAGDVSRLFIYYNARKLDDAVGVDEGSYLQSCVGVLREYGACSEQTWPFDLDRILDVPHANAYDEATAFLIHDAARVEVKLKAMRSCLAEGYPFTFGLMLFESFQQAGKTGLVPMPDIEQEKMDGGHAMLCVGYSDADRVFIIRNSWGADWGDEGYCYIPYAYMTNPDLNGDCWTIRQTDAGPDLSTGITRDAKSVFSNRAVAKVARNFQTPGAGLNPNCYDSLGAGYYNQVSYEREFIYDRTGNQVPLDQVENVDALYFEESEYSITYEAYDYEYYEESSLEYWETWEEYSEESEEYSEESEESMEYVETFEVTSAEDDDSADDDEFEDDSDANDSEEEDADEDDSEEEDSEGDDSDDEESDEESDEEESEDDASEEESEDESEDDASEEESEDESEDDASEEEDGGDDGGDDGGGDGGDDE